MGQADKVLVTNAKGIIAASNITTTELNALDGFATGSGTIQAQLNGKASKTSKYIDYASGTNIMNLSLGYAIGKGSIEKTYTASKDCYITLTTEFINKKISSFVWVQVYVNSTELPLLVGKVYCNTSNNVQLFLKSGDVLKVSASINAITDGDKCYINAYSYPWG